MDERSAPGRARRSSRAASRLASVELLDAETLALAVARTIPTDVDLHDEPVRQSIELGHPLTAEQTAAFESLVASNVEAFRYVIAP